MTDAAGHALTLAVALTVCGAAAVPFAAELLRRLPRRGPVFFARWGFSHVLLAAALALVASFVAAPIAFAVEGTERGQPLGVVAALWLTMAMTGSAALCAGVLARRLHPEGLGALGFERGGNGRACLAGGLAYLLVLPGYFGVASWWPSVAAWLGFEPEPQPVLMAIRELHGPALWQAVVLAVLIGPLLEETVFRGFLQPLLVQNLRERGGIAVTSALFAALHGASAFAPLFVLSLLLGYVQLRTRRLAAPWFVHGLHNGLTLFLVLGLDLPTSP